MFHSPRVCRPVGAIMEDQKSSKTSEKMKFPKLLIRNSKQSNIPIPDGKPNIWILILILVDLNITV